MDDSTATDIMARFGKAFFARDRAGLEQILTPDAEWHFAIGDDAPHGRVRVGVDGFIQGIEENAAMFPRLQFNEVVCRGLGDDQIVMTYTLDGQDRDGTAFALRGMELITVRDGCIALKDVFWKQRGTGTR